MTPPGPARTTMEPLVKKPSFGGYSLPARRGSSVEEAYGERRESYPTIIHDGKQTSPSKHSRSKSKYVWSLQGPSLGGVESITRRQDLEAPTIVQTRGRQTDGPISHGAGLHGARANAPAAKGSFWKESNAPRVNAPRVNNNVQPKNSIPNTWAPSFGTQAGMTGSSVIMRKSVVQQDPAPRPTRRVDNLHRRLRSEMGQRWGEMTPAEREEDRAKAPDPKKLFDKIKKAIDTTARLSPRMIAEKRRRQRPKTGKAEVEIPEDQLNADYMLPWELRQQPVVEDQPKVPWGDNFYQARGLAKPTTGTSPRKAGPRDIGRFENFAPVDYGVVLHDNAKNNWEQPGFLSPKYHIKSDVDTKGVKAPRKEGPKEIGVAKDFVPVDYGVVLESEKPAGPYAAAEFLKPRILVKTNTTAKVEKKPGPIDIGRNQDFEQPDYGVSLEAEQGKPYGLSMYPKLDGLAPAPGKSPKKRGPVDIGWANGFQKPGYGVELQTQMDDQPWRFNHLQPTYDLRGVQEGTVPRKIGPVEVGRNLDFAEPDYGVDLSPKKADAPWGLALKFLEPRLDLRGQKTSTERAEHKPGPVETGRNEDYVDPEYELPEDLGPRGTSFLEPRPFQPASHVRELERQPRKPGPLDIGRATDYEPYEHEFDGATSKSFLSPRTPIRRLISPKDKATIRKAGPRDIGKNSDYEALEYDYEGAQGRSFLLERLTVPAPRGEIDAATREAIKKAGPIEIGRNFDYDALDYDYEGANSGDFLKEHVTHAAKPIDPKAKAAIKKAGPLDIGRIDYDALEYDYEGAAGGDFLLERLQVAKASPGKAKRKAGPREIGRIDYDALEYDYEGAEGSSFLKERMDARAKSKGKTMFEPIDPGSNDAFKAFEKAYLSKFMPKLETKITKADKKKEDKKKEAAKKELEDAAKPTHTADPSSSIISYPGSKFESKKTSRASSVSGSVGGGPDWGAALDENLATGYV